jgi:hypothetical protein
MGSSRLISTHDWRILVDLLWRTDVEVKVDEEE